MPKGVYPRKKNNSVTETPTQTAVQNYAPGYCSQCRRFYKERYFGEAGFVQANRERIPEKELGARATEYLSWAHGQPNVVPCDKAGCGMFAEFISAEDLHRNRTQAQRLRLRKLAEGQA
jgi:hypothetical protein